VEKVRSDWEDASCAGGPYFVEVGDGLKSEENAVCSIQYKKHGSAYGLLCFLPVSTSILPCSVAKVEMVFSRIEQSPLW
jgi:hypothetical protein